MLISKARKRERVRKDNGRVDKDRKTWGRRHFKCGDRKSILF